jgi:ribonuclease G
MQKEIIINSNPGEERIAIREDGRLVEFMIERAQNRRLVGDIYLGRVTAVLPGIQSAFVEIGLEKAAFLHVSDMPESIDDFTGFDDQDEGNGGGPDRSSKGSSRGRGRPESAPIESRIKKGDEILVQITKEPIANKGPRVSTQISLPGRFAVFIPGFDHIGISRKISNYGERRRLRKIVRQFLGKKKAAIIVRTAAEGVEEKALLRDLEYLSEVWEQVWENRERVSPPCQVHEDVGMIIGLARDLFTEDVQSIKVDDETVFQKLQNYAKRTDPSLTSRVSHFKNNVPIFDYFKIEDDLDRMLDRKVWLKKGGYITIDHTEALVSIDVNTGRFTGKRNQEETILETNLLAAAEIARQLRLRDIGGIIVIDFIDMENAEGRRKVYADLKGHLKKDKARTKIFEVSELGLVEMTRQRVRPSILHFYSEECPYCEGMGNVLSHDSVANKIEHWLRRLGSYGKERDLQIRVNPTVALTLVEQRAEVLDRLQKEYRLRISVLDDPRLHRESFKIVGLHTGKDLTELWMPEKKRSKPSRDSDSRKRGSERSRRSGRSGRGRSGKNGKPQQAPSEKGRSQHPPRRKQPRGRRRRGGRSRQGSGAS